MPVAQTFTVIDRPYHDIGISFRDIIKTGYEDGTIKQDELTALNALCAEFETSAEYTRCKAQVSELLERN